MFEDISLIGNGGFGYVYKAKYKIDKNIYAVKQILLVLGKDD
jgi:serine/threonine protein kinase